MFTPDETADHSADHSADRSADHTADRAASGASRRAFLSTATLTGLAAGAAGAVGWSAEAAAAKRAYVPARYSLELDNARAGVPATAVGGDAYGIVTAQHRTGGDVPNKVIVNTAISDITIGCGPGMSAAFYAALADFTSGGVTYHRGKVTRRDDAGTAFRVTDFNRAAVTSLVLPAVETGTTHTAQLVAGLTPNEAGVGGAAGAAQTPAARRPWQTGRFTLSLAGISTAKVVKVGAITIKRAVLPGVRPGDPFRLDDLDVSDLVVTVADNNPADLNAWFRSFLINGERSDADERTGQLVYRDVDNRPVFVVKFGGLGIYRLTPAAVLVGNERFVRTTATMYCERAVLSVVAGVPL